VCLIGDNCNTNKALATLARRPLVGCASHRFNLAVKDLLKEYSDLLNDINALMKKLKNLIPSAKLRKFTALRPKCSNATRWSSTYEMLKRYKELEAYLPMLNVREIDDLMPSGRNLRDIDLLLTLMYDFQSVTKALQEEAMTMLDVRCLFDEVMGTFNGTDDRLGVQASIIHDRTFENAIQKILRGEEKQLSVEEYIKMTPLRVVDQKG
jgi:hypothetical protein